MIEVRYVIKDEIGIHARPAGLMVKSIAKFNCSVKIVKGSVQKDARSILGLMGLGAKKGDEIVLSFDGDDEAEASETIKAFLLENL